MMILSDKVAISASRLGTACQCTLRYYYNYILKLPQEEKDYFILGSLSHLVLEILQYQKHREHYDLIIKKNNVFASKAIERLIRKHVNKHRDLVGHRVDDICGFILTGLKYNFFCDGCNELLDPELNFDIETKEYRLKGFIDKSAIYSSYAYVGDYKTSKRKPPESEKDGNVQALVYALVLRHKFGRFEKYRIDFIYVKFAKDPLYRCEYNNEDLDYFEFYLSNVSKYLTNFSHKNRLDVIPKGTYRQPMYCGAFNDELKADLTPKFICQFKYKLSFFGVYKEGKIYKTALTEKELEGEGLEIKKLQHNGCEVWKKDIEYHHNNN